MYQTVNFQQFRDAFVAMGRENQFTYDGLKALFDYLEFMEQDTGQEIELDVIALCCEYSEIDEDEEAYKEYVGEHPEREDLVIAKLYGSVLVQEG